MSAYGLRISDWSSDVCSSDLGDVAAPRRQGARRRGHDALAQHDLARARLDEARKQAQRRGLDAARGDRKSGGKGKSVSGRVDLGGRRIIKKKNMKKLQRHKPDKKRKQK